MNKNVVAAIAAGALLLTACSNSDPLAEPTESGGGDSQTVVVGSQQYYSNEIIAELYAQALEGAGVTVERQFQIGQREIYLPELESGKIDVIPEYGGNLMQYLDEQASASDAAGIEQAINDALPDHLRALPAAEATDQDSYTVTQAFADEHALKTIADLAKVGGPITIAANSEFESRPYGPQGAKEKYGIDLKLVPVEDSGGPLTVKALTSGDAQVADIYTADPAISANGLVALEDPDGLILPQQVTPIVSDKVTDEAADAINKVNAELTQEELVALNAESVNEQRNAPDIAKDWLSEHGLN